MHEFTAFPQAGRHTGKPGAWAAAAVPDAGVAVTETGYLDVLF